jgi:dihydroxyacetone kinase
MHNLLAILMFLSTRDFSGDAVVDVAEIVPLVEKTMDGTSGALYAIFLNALVRSLAASPSGEATPQVWAKALEQSSAAMSKYTSARPGDRTLVDALYPFIETLGKTGDLKEAAKAASIGAEHRRREDQGYESQPRPDSLRRRYRVPRMP